MDACTQSQCYQMKPKLSVKKENVCEGLLSSVKSLLQSRKELCTITDGLKSNKTGDFIEVTFLGLSEEAGAGNIQGASSFHLDIPELIRSLHLCNLNENEVLLLKDGKEATKSNAPQGLCSGTVCLLSTTPFPFSKSDALFVMLSKYTAGVKYAVEQDCLNRLNKKAEHHEDDDTNHSVSSIEDDFVTALEHLDEEEPTKTNDSQGLGWETLKNQCDASSQTQPANCLDISGSKIIFSSVRRRSSIKSAVLMGYLGLPEISSAVKNTVTTSMCNTWTQRNVSAHEKIIFSPSPVDTSESECSSPSPIIFLDEVGYQKSLRAKLNLPKIPVGKDDIEDSDSEVSEFFDSFDRFDEPETLLEAQFQNNQKAVLASPPKKRKCAKGSIRTVCMNPQKFKFDRPTLSASVKKPTPRKAESPFSSMTDVPDSPRPTKTSEENGTLFSPIRSSAFSPPGVPSSTESTSHSPFKDHSHNRLSEYANKVCSDMFDTVLNTKPASNTGKKEQEKTPKLKRKPHGKELERKSKSKHKSIKGGIQKFAADLVEKSLGNAFKDLQRGVSSCTSALCHLAARLTSYVFQMAFYEIGRRQAFSIKKRAINSLANLMVSEVITSALQELRYIKKQMVTNAVTRFAADLAEELVFEGIMEVCQFSHPPTPSVSYCQTFDYEDLVVSSYAKDLSESVIQEAFIELSQVNVGFTPEAAISVSMDNLKYVSAEGIHFQSSPIFPAPRTQDLSPVAEKSKKDYTVQYALFFTSGLVSSVPVPIAAKVLSQQPISNDQTEISPSKNFCVDNVKNYHISTKNISNMSSDKKIILGTSQQDGDGMQTFSVTMVDMIVNEAYDVIKSAKTVDDYAEMMTRKIIVMPSSSDGSTSQNGLEDSGKAVFKHSISKSMQTSSDKLEEMKSGSLVDYSKNLTEMIYYSPKSLEQQKRIFRCPQVVEHTTPSPYFTGKQPGYKCDPMERHLFGTCPGTSNTLYNKLDKETINSKRNTHSTDASDPSLFGLHSCLPHINSFSSVMCSCGDDFDEKNIQKDPNVLALPGTPPPTPLTTYDISPERSMRKLNRRLKGQLAKEFYPATPPSTPHLSSQEHDNGKKDDFMLRLMRSLSEEVESSSSSDDSSEELEVSEETSRYADYLSSNIISIATDMAAYSLDDDSSQGATSRNVSQLSVLSDKWGYPAYMRNITEELLETLCKYANNVAGEVISEAKETIGSRKNSLCDVEYGNSQTSGKDCRQKESNFNYAGMSYKASDPTTLSLPHNTCGSGLTSKYPSCESVTEEYADHLIRVLKMEGGNSELILDQYASRLVYRAMKSGLQQASKTIKVKCNRKIVSRVKSEASTSKNILRLFSRTHHTEKDKRRQSNVQSFTEDPGQKTELTGLLHFAESLAQTITCDVRRKLKMSAASLPKSLTDSCLYSKSKNNNVSGDLVKSSFPKLLLPLPHKQKLYHSTSSLNDHGLNDGIVKAIEQYACKVVDRTLEASMEAARLQAMESKKKTEKVPQAGKLIHSYGTACRLCSAIEQHGGSVSSCHFLLGPDSARKSKPCSKSRQNACQKSRLFHLNIPKIHIDLEKRSVFADKIVSAALEKAERELSNTSLGADSGIGHSGMSFAESLTAEIMMSAMKNIGHVSISSIGKDGFQSVDSVTSQHTSISVGDDSTGSWSNLSFEDEHQDECSSFLHLSDSNGNSSSWSSLGLEGDMCEENLSFPPSDSDSTEDKEEEPKMTEVVNQPGKILYIRNVDMGPSPVESQLRTMLQWIAASESGISEIHFLDHAKQELLPLLRRVREKGWKIGDLLQAVVQYCENSDLSSDIPGPVYGWLLEYC